MVSKILYTFDKEFSTTVYKPDQTVNTAYLGSTWVKPRIKNPVSMPLSMALDRNVQGFLFLQIGTNESPDRWTGFRNKESPNVIDVLPEKLKSRLRNRMALVTYDQSREAYPLVDQYFNYYQAFHDNFTKYDLPAEQFAIITSNLVESKLYEAWCENNNIVAKMTVIGSNFFAATCAEDHFFFDGQNTIPFKKHIEHKRNNDIQLFNCLNRVVRNHRVALVTMLNYYNLLDDNQVSHASYPNNFSSYINDFTHHPAFNQTNVNSTYHKLPLNLDQTDFEINQAQNFYPEVYLNTWVSVITETFYTDYPDQVIFFSEKIYKPIRALHPFILVGTQNSIRELKVQGFKTFSNWWDESYDDIPDPTTRLEAVCKLLLQLSTKTNSEWMTMYEEMQDILEHNHTHLMTNDWPKDLTPGIIDKLG